MQRAGGPGGVGAAIVGSEDKDRVVELAELFEQRHEAADILVGAVKHRGIGFHVPRKEPLLVGGNIVPGRHRRITLGKPAPRRDQPHRHLALKARGAERVPAGIVPAAVFRQIGFLGLQRPVHGIVGDVEKERPARVLVADLGDEADRLFHPIVGRVVALGIGVDRRDDVVVDDARRKEIPGLAFEKPVETVEAAMGRPGRDWARRRRSNCATCRPRRSRIRPRAGFRRSSARRAECPRNSLGSPDCCWPAIRSPPNGR